MAELVENYQQDEETMTRAEDKLQVVEVNNEMVEAQEASTSIDQMPTATTQNQDQTKSERSIKQIDIKEKQKFQSDLQKFIKSVGGSKNYGLRSITASVDGIYAFKNLYKLWKFSSDTEDTNWAIQIYCQPFVDRFKFHFEQNVQTNRLDKSEWWINYALKIINSHYEEQDQWKLLSVESDPTHIFIDFVQYFVEVCVKPKFKRTFKTIVKKLDQLQSNKSNPTQQQSSPNRNQVDDGWNSIQSTQDEIYYHQLLCQLVQEIQGFDKTLVETYNLGNYFKSSQFLFSIVTDDTTYYENWYNSNVVNFNFKFDRIMTSDSLWARAFPDVEIENDQYKASQCSVQIMDLMNFISQIMSTLQKKNQKLDFIDVQIDLLDRFSLYLESLISPLNDKFIYLKPIEPEQIDGFQALSQIKSGIQSGIDSVKSKFQTSDQNDEDKHMFWIKGLGRWACSLLYVKNALKVMSVQEFYLTLNQELFKETFTELDRLIEMIIQVLSSLSTHFMITHLQNFSKIKTFKGDTDDVIYKSVYDRAAAELHKTIVFCTHYLENLKRALPFDLALESLQSTLFVKIISNFCDGFDAVLFDHLLQCIYDDDGVHNICKIIEKNLNSFLSNFEQDLLLVKSDNNLLISIMFPRMFDVIRLVNWQGLSSFDFQSLDESDAKELVKQAGLKRLSTRGVYCLIKRIET